MKMILTLLLTMSASGTLAFLVYLLAVFLTHEQISAHLRYLILKICLAFFLIPFPLLKYVAVSYFAQPYSSYSESVVFLDVAHSVNLTDSGLLLPYISLFYRKGGGIASEKCSFCVFLQPAAAFSGIHAEPAEGCRARQIPNRQLVAVGHVEPRKVVDPV